MNEEMIRRSDAIKAIDELPNAYNGWSDAYDKAYIIGTLEEVPSAEITEKDVLDYCRPRLLNVIVKESIPSADRPQGEWETEYHGNGWNDYWDYTCSNCGKKYERADAVLYKATFCPNCGARMKGAGDES